MSHYYSDNHEEYSMYGWVPMHVNTSKDILEIPILSWKWVREMDPEDAFKSCNLIICFFQ